jgi:hypothetical protein
LKAGIYDDQEKKGGPDEPGREREEEDRTGER